MTCESCDEMENAGVALYRIERNIFSAAYDL